MYRKQTVGCTIRESRYSIASDPVSLLTGGTGTGRVRFSVAFELTHSYHSPNGVERLPRVFALVDLKPLETSSKNDALSKDYSDGSCSVGGHPVNRNR